MPTPRTLARIVVPLACAALTIRAQAQSADTSKHRSVVTGAISITNKGVSVIPTFTLGKPAATIDLVVRKRRVSFEPQFRVALDGKPWSFVFWGRYQLVQRARFHVQAGAHPAVIFRRTTTTIGEATAEYLVARRYLATEFSPSYALTQHINLSAYYLYSRGIEHDAVRNTNFLSARAALTGIPLSRGFVLQFDPQLYYLHTAGQHGYYANSGVTLARHKLPASLSATANKPLQTNVTGGTAFLWNVSLNIAFR